MTASVMKFGKRWLSPVLSLLGILVFAMNPMDEAHAAAPAWQASSGIAASTGADVTVTLPAHQADDIFLLQVVVRDTNDTITWPAGWTQIATVDRGTTARYWWAWKRAASSSETNPLVDKNTTTGDTYAAVTTYRGAITTGDPWEVKGTPNTSISASHVLNGITTLSADSLVVASLCGENNSSASGTTFSATNPASLAQVLYVESSTGSDGACTAGTGAKTATGTTGSVTTTWTASNNGSGGIVLALKPPPQITVTAISPNSGPTAGGTSVTITGTNFTGATSVTVGGTAATSVVVVNATTITAVTPAGTAGAQDVVVTTPGGSGTGAGLFTYVAPPPTCDPPANAPPGLTLTCVCDNFTRATLNPSTIFNSNWIVSTSDSTGVVPYINTSGLLRLTENTGNNAKAATVPGIFPAAGNYISVEFKNYAYNGSGADGIAVTLSDYSVPAVPGAFGGSLGYAQKTGINGFAGGWIGVAVDEYGNYQNPTEGRIGGPGFRVDSVGIRGSGTGTNNYRWLAGTGTLTPGIDLNTSSTPAPGHSYQVIVDARNEPTATAVQVNRDTGSGYQSLISLPDVYMAATGQGFTQDPVPANWQISFTGSTGGSTNIHEIGSLRVCAQTIYPPSGGTASDFNAVDDSYGTPPSVAVQNYLTGHIYMKLVGVPFRLNVAALSNNQIQTAYVVSGSKNVTVKLVDNTDNACVLDSSQPNYCSTACKNKTAVAGGSQTLNFTSANAGQKQSTDFTLNTAYSKLVAIISDGTVTGCSTDSFSVRPVAISQVTSTDATNGGTSGNPKFRASSDQFTLQAIVAGVAGNASGYNGVLKVNNGKLQIVSPATTAGLVAPTTFSAATPGTGSSTATGLFTYSEVGAFLLGASSGDLDPRGVYGGVHASECSGLTTPQCNLLIAATWSGIDAVSTAGDCVPYSYSNTKTNGKYGCNFGYTAATPAIGRFYPHHFDTTAQNACGPSFTYSGQAFPASVTAARDASGNRSMNYQGTLAKNITFSDGNGAAGTFSPQPLLASNFTAGLADLTATPVVRFAFSDPLTAPATLKLRATDEDGASSSSGTEGTVTLRSGRLRLSNAHGSELLDLPVPLEAQYWNGTLFTTNTLDNCTTIAPGNIVLSTFQGNLAACETAVSISGSLVAGKANLKMLKPGAGNNGSVNLTVNLGSTALGSTCLTVGGATSTDVPANMSYLQSRWTGATYDQNPSGRATFGVYKNANEFIYLREMY